MRLKRLLMASVGPLDPRARCQATIWSRQRAMVRPGDRTSLGFEALLEVVGEVVDELDSEVAFGDPAKSVG